ncbi:SDR family oxidoreductase [Paenisporosarcina antarctica]|uniref:SDR family oxidoreductase n=1 Tax=Paenisporosarcina antarctica TaxID=417367 RepID=A0A4P6ZTX0_9BACL|nr:SDR family oxidoreductase [Paenisporosarcina antarctica]QBP39910.1 SDR family oxidoreductase [Paenisporosarcina antarctica]
MDLQLKDKVVLVTASSKGLGKATALEFAKEGATVLISSRNEATLAQTVDEIKQLTNNQQVYAKTCDMSSVEDINALFAWVTAEFGGADILINNTGGPTAGGFKDLEDSDWMAAFEKNLLSYIRTTRAVLPHMEATNFGRIINISSSSTKEVIDGLILSNTFRSGMVGLTKSLAREYAKNNILVNTIGPGRIATDRVAELDQIAAAKQSVSVEDIVKRSESLIPIGRYGQPEEFAKVVLFLASPANTYMTGQSLIIDGGMLKAL